MEAGVSVVGHHLLLRGVVPDRVVDQAPTGGLADGREGGAESGEADAVSAVLHRGGELHLLHADRGVRAVHGDGVQVPVDEQVRGGGSEPSVLHLHWVQVQAGDAQPVLRARRRRGGGGGSGGAEGR